MVDRLTDEPIYKTSKKYLYNKITELSLNNYISCNHKFAERMFNPLVSPEGSTIVFRVKKISYKQLADFMQKLFDKSLYTREAMFLSRNKKLHKPHPNANKEKTLNLKYKENHCIFCCENLEVKIIENHEHIFSHCPAYLSFRNDKYDNIIKIINAQAGKNIISEFSPWFTCDKGRLPYDQTEKELYEFPKHLGDMGYIPKALMTWIKMLKIKKARKVTKQIILSIQHSTKNIWINRCKNFHSHKFTPTNPEQNPHLPNEVFPALPQSDSEEEWQ